MMRFLYLVLLGAMLSSCATIKDNAADLAIAAGGVAVVASSDQIAEDLVEYIQGDEIAINGLLGEGGPVETGLAVADFLGLESQTSFLEVALGYPEMVAFFIDSMLEGRAVVTEYAIRSKKPIPPSIKANWRLGEAAVTRAQEIIQTNDRVSTVLDVMDSARPWALIAARLAGAPI